MAGAFRTSRNRISTGSFLALGLVLDTARLEDVAQSQVDEVTHILDVPLDQRTKGVAGHQAFADSVPLEGEQHLLVRDAEFKRHDGLLPIRADLRQIRIRRNAVAEAGRRGSEERTGVDDQSGAAVVVLGDIEQEAALPIRHHGRNRRRDFRDRLQIGVERSRQACLM